MAGRDTGQERDHVGRLVSWATALYGKQTVLAPAENAIMVAALEALATK